MSYLPKSGISPRKSWKIHSSTKIKVLWTVHKWHHLLWGEGDLPKGDNSPWAYLVKWVTRGREAGVKNLKKIGWLTSFMDGPYQQKCHNFFMLLCYATYIPPQYYENLGLSHSLFLYSRRLFLELKIDS